MARFTFVLLALSLSVFSAQAATDCSRSALPQPLSLPVTVGTPLAEELYARSLPLGMPSGVLSQSYGDNQSIERVLLRLRVQGCEDIARSLPAQGDNISPDDPAAYKPQTEFDNTPWRFDMVQDGKQMTADEFDEWMQARGLRVVRAKPTVEAAVEAAPAAEVQSQ